MLGLPKSTELHKQLPKTAIYTRFSMSASAKERFDEDISRLVIVNEISKATSSITSGSTVSSFYVVLVSLKRKEYNDATIEQISKLINQNMLFILECKNESKLAVYSTKIISSEWKPSNNLIISLKGHDLNTVWDNIIKDLEGGEWNDTLSVEENILRHEQIKQLQKQIDDLEKKARAEVQPKKKYELVQQISDIKQKAQVLRNVKEVL